MSVCSKSNWNLEVLVFKERRKLQYLEKNLSAKERTNNKLNPHMVSTTRFQHGPHPLLPEYSHGYLYFHLLWSMCTVTLRVKIFTHGFYIWLFFGDYECWLPYFFTSHQFFCIYLLTYGKSTCNHSETCSI